MRSSNPIFSKNLNITNEAELSERSMTVAGTMSKLMLLSVVMLISAAAVFYQFSMGRFDMVNIMMWIGVWVGLILAFVIPFFPKTAPYLAPIYAFAEGAFLSAVSCRYESVYSGIILQAVSITILTVFAMAFLFMTRIIKATDKFRAVIGTATLAIFIFYLISLILMLFHVNVPYFTSNSTLFIAINVGIALVAALNLIMDFDNTERGVAARYPVFMEWYNAFGLLVTIVWLYIEILRLLTRLRDR